MSKKQKLELTWIGKDKRPRLEPRILLADKALSYRAAQAVTGNDLHDNLRLIYGHRRGVCAIRIRRSLTRIGQFVSIPNWSAVGNRCL